MTSVRLGLAHPWTARLPAGGPQLGRRSGQRLARQELAEVSFWQRILNWLARLLHGAQAAVPGGWLGLIILGALAAAAIMVVIFWVRPTPRRRATRSAVLGGRAASASDHRKEAERRAAAGDFGGAIVCGVRAIAMELEERGVVSPRPGRTADELAAEAGRALRALAPDLRRVAGLFDDVRYGDRPGSAEGYALVMRVDAEVRLTRAAVISDPRPQTLAGLGVPRP
jgi:hypothetical protein